MRFALWIMEDEAAPYRPFYGVAWYDFSGKRPRLLCLPIPLNVIAALVRRFWLWLHFPFAGHLTDAETREWNKARWCDVCHGPWRGPSHDAWHARLRRAIEDCNPGLDTSDL